MMGVSILALLCVWANADVVDETAMLQRIPRVSGGYCLPGQRCWPSKVELDVFNASLGGNVFYPSTSPTLPECNIECGDGVYRNTGMDGDLPALAVHVHCADDVKRAIHFADQHNIRVVVKNLGNSYRGESAGQGALMIFTRGLREIDVKDRFESCGKTHPAVKVGGGTVWEELYTFLNETGAPYSAFGGTCNSVSATGGYLQGIGLSSQLNRMHGFAVDNVLQFDIVLPTGEQVLASECENADLFRVLRGGGGGAWGVLISVHYKLLPHYKMQAVDLLVTVDNSYPLFRIIAKHAINMDKRLQIIMFGSLGLFKIAEKKYHGLEGLHFEHLPALRAEHGDLKVTLLRFSFLGNRDDLLEQPFYQDVMKLNLLNVTEESFSSLTEMKLKRVINFACDWKNTTEFSGVRIVPRSAFGDVDSAAALLQSVQDQIIGACGGGFYHLGGTAYENSLCDPDATYVHPNMRNGIFALNIRDPEVNKRWLAKGGEWTGTSINHAAWFEENWQDNLWGVANYRKLLQAKKRYDPKRLFYCRRCVGWEGD